LEKAIHAYPDLPGYADQVAARLQSEWGRELNLDASQSEMLRGELSATAHEIKQFRFDTVNRFQEICRNTLTRIESKLPAEKRGRFHAIAEAESKRWDIPLEQ
jgi:hypothetical protein